MTSIYPDLGQYEFRHLISVWSHPGSCWTMKIRDGEEFCPWEGPHHNGVYKAQGETGMLARLKGNANMDRPREPWPKLISFHLHSGVTVNAAKACQITPRPF